MKKRIVTFLLGVFALGTALSLTAAEKTEAAKEAATETKASAAVLNQVKKGEWLENYESAMAAAKELNRPVFIDFTGSDWCGWCVRLDKEVFGEKEFTKYAKKELVLLKIDFPRRKRITEEQKKQNMELAQKFGIRGFPTIIIVDSTGRQIATTGYRRGGAKDYVKHLKELLKSK